jgi:hypothetical protein
LDLKIADEKIQQAPSQQIEQVWKAQESQPYLKSDFLFACPSPPTLFFGGAVV